MSRMTAGVLMALGRATLRKRGPGPTEIKLGVASVEAKPVYNSHNPVQCCCS